jgi:hypothetical protein
MPSLLFRWNGKALKRNGLAARSQRCCCDQTPGGKCCGCPDFPLSAFSSLDVSITGAISGSGTIPQDNLGTGHCVRFFGAVTLSGNCGGEFAALQVEVRCPEGSKLPTDITCALIGGGGACAFKEGSGFHKAPDSITCGPPLEGTWTFHTMAILPDGCPCGENQVITVVIKEVP